MSYFITVNGKEIRCETLDDLRRLLDAKWLEGSDVGSWTSTPSRSPTSPGTTNPTLPKYLLEVRERYLQMIAGISALIDAGKDGLRAGELAPIIGLRGPGGISGRMRGFQASLAELGFAMGDVFIHARVGHSNRHAWFAGSKARSAIKACEKAAAAV